MKWYQIFGFSINALAALYFLYMAAMHIFVYVMNKREGHYVDFLDSRINLIPGLGLTIITFLAWVALKNQQSIKLGNILLFLPLSLVLGYGLFAVFLLMVSGGKWN
jgi:hypothetical protein